MAKVLMFGIVREIVGSHTMEIDVKALRCIRDLKSHLVMSHPELRDLVSIRFALNDEYVDDSELIGEGDEIVVIPPVSGG